jgi:starch synthase
MSRSNRTRGDGRENRRLAARTADLSVKGTSVLVPIEPLGDGTGEPFDPGAFARALAERIETVLADPVLAERFGRAGRERAVEHFAWDAIAERVVEVYRGVLA